MHSRWTSGTGQKVDSEWANKSQSNAICIRLLAWLAKLASKVWIPLFGFRTNELVIRMIIQITSVYIWNVKRYGRLVGSEWWMRGGKQEDCVMALCDGTKWTVWQDLMAEPYMMEPFYESQLPTSMERERWRERWRETAGRSDNSTRCPMNVEWSEFCTPITAYKRSALV